MASRSKRRCESWCTSTCRVHQQAFVRICLVNAWTDVRRAVVHKLALSLRGFDLSEKLTTDDLVVEKVVAALAEAVLGCPLRCPPLR